MSTIIVISVEKRQEISAKVQEVLTKFGCIIQTRLGLHNSSKDSCSSNGLIILECIDNKEEIEKLNDSLLKIEGIKVKIVNI
jgi:hypothetical protein